LHNKVKQTVKHTLTNTN